MSAPGRRNKALDRAPGTCLRRCSGGPVFAVRLLFVHDLFTGSRERISGRDRSISGTPNVKGGHPDVRNHDLPGAGPRRVRLFSLQGRKERRHLIQKKERPKAPSYSLKDYCFSWFLRSSEAMYQAMAKPTAIITRLRMMVVAFRVGITLPSSGPKAVHTMATGLASTRPMMAQ